MTQVTQKPGAAKQEMTTEDTGSSSAPQAEQKPATRKAGAAKVPSIGRSVHFFVQPPPIKKLSKDENGNDVETYEEQPVKVSPATITNVDEDPMGNQTVNLAIFDDDSGRVVFKKGVHHSDKDKGGSWGWPQMI